MELTINYIAVFVAGLVSMVLGALWYGPVFGKTWMKLSGMTQKDLEAAKKKSMALSYGLNFVGVLITAYVLAHFLEIIETVGNTSWETGLVTGFWIWLGFAAPLQLSSVLWENKPWTLWILNTVYSLLSFVVMGVILAVWI